MKYDLPLARPDAGDAGPGPRWFSLLPPIAAAQADANEKRRCAPSPRTVVRAWAAAGTREGEAA